MLFYPLCIFLQKMRLLQQLSQKIPRLPNRPRYNFKAVSLATVHYGNIDTLLKLFNNIPVVHNLARTDLLEISGLWPRKQDQSRGFIYS